MKALPNPYDFSNTVCVCGVFDGVHVGHRALIAKAVEQAKRLQASVVIITFQEDPDELFLPHGFHKLMTNEHRLFSLEQLDDVSDVYVIPFNTAIAALPPEVFLDTLFATSAPRALFVGVDFHFGVGAKGSLQTLLAWGRTRNVLVEGVSLVCLDGAPITATRIRALVREGNIAQANLLLGHPFSLSGLVVDGRKEGRKMGVCTANIAVAPDIIVPADGVYAGFTEIEGVKYKAAISVGIPITFANATESTIEAHLIGFEGNIYGAQITLSFVERLRPMIRFDNIKDLLEQIQRDISDTKQLIELEE